MKLNGKIGKTRVDLKGGEGEGRVGKEKKKRG